MTKPKPDLNRALQSMERAASARTRWYILETANKMRPQDTTEEILVAVFKDTDCDLSQRELRQEIDYLERRKLLDVVDRDATDWVVSLTRIGIDVVLGTAECGPGIDRPER